MPDSGNYWFPAKRYGWGWGLPIAWQGWLVLAAFFVLVLLGIRWFPPRQSMPVFFLYIAVITALLTGVCWLKGEPPRWRWGKN